MTARSLSTRALTLSYAVALLIIAALSITSHAVLDYGLSSDEGSAAIINQCGRQRMLSQRIASLAAQYRLGDASAQPALVQAISEFETSHAELLRDTRDATHSQAQPRLMAIYFQGDDPLDRQVGNFVAEARKVAGMAPNDPGQAALLAAIFAQSRGPLLEGLEAVVTVQQDAAEQRVISLQRLQWTILAVVLMALGCEAIWIFRPMIRRIARYTAELVHLATTDPLTGAANRRSFMERGGAELDRARRHGRPASLIMLDIDHFKSINDTYGHAAGDEVLRVIGAILAKTLRQEDIWGRLGGEEFAVLMAETGLSGAALVADRLTSRVAGTEVFWGEQRITFTVSAGVSALLTEDGGLEKTMHAADGLLYKAKQAGRNQTVVQEVAA